MWTLAFGQHEDWTTTHGYAESRARLPWRHSQRAGGGNSQKAHFVIAITARAPSQSYVGRVESLPHVWSQFDVPPT